LTRESVAEMRARLSLVALAGLVAAGGAVWLATMSSVHRPTEPGPALTLVVAASLMGSGLGAWRAWPENRVGQ
jgi:hypothetical protein